MTPIGLIFDMDGVLVDSYAPHLKSWCLLAEEIGTPITETQFAATFGRTGRDVIRELFGVEDEAAMGRIDHRKETIYRDLIRDAMPTTPGIVEAVVRLHAAGFRLAVGSSGPPENVQLVCEELDLYHYLTKIITGADVQRGKPDPQVFELAAAGIGVEPARCVVVEDAPVGIQAAHAAQMRCIALVGTHPAASLRNADRIINHADELTPELIHRIADAS
jgi:beta-phosphoglucomutase